MTKRFFYDFLLQYMFSRMAIMVMEFQVNIRFFAIISCMTSVMSLKSTTNFTHMWFSPVRILILATKVTGIRFFSSMNP